MIANVAAAEALHAKRYRCTGHEQPSMGDVERSAVARGVSISVRDAAHRTPPLAQAAKTDKLYRERFDSESSISSLQP